ncbi:hypothetical protein CIPAW_08G109000 [Carya illinoinensis]|uniref:Endonuclease/exonuclease/phosphatase domain-containing protein n=1 Tax=Carya illinoinensis TaxID=32201 RepID=A0A8T1PSN1_CARIL|nr:hypothetical protein CIPAW_08G109000 [Carya illinoinensis]
MKQKIVSWNVRGINEASKRLQIRNLLRGWKVEIICLQETKLKVVTRKIVQSIWSCIHVDWVHLAADGASRGVLVMWDQWVVEKRVDFIGGVYGNLLFSKCDRQLFVGLCRCLWS